MLWTRVPASRPRLQPSPDRRKLFRETNQLGVMAESLPFEDVELAERAIAEPILHVDVDGFEGPLDLLLELARRQKVDLHRISILALAEQYLVFIEEARKMRLELAADYLVMAAWLAYLKSRLLLPEGAKGDEPSAADLATALALRLRRLEAIREAAKRMEERAQLGRDVFARGAPEPIAIRKEVAWEATLYDLLSAYARQRQKQMTSRVVMPKRHVWSLVDAREALERLLGQAQDWTVLDSYLVRYISAPEQRPTVIASAFSASLELVREGRLALRQDGAFAPLWVRGLTPEPREALRIAEALLFAAREPLAAQELAGRLPEGSDVAAVLADLAEHYADRGVNLVQVAGKWAFRTAGDLSFLLARDVVEPRKLSRAAMETLAIVAYHQPVTRAEIEEIRGVVTSKGRLDTLLETGWIRLRGRRKAPGRPVTYGTTPRFLEHFGINAVDDLPGLEELKGAGMLDGRIPPGLSVPVPSDDTTLRADEDPLEDDLFQPLPLEPEAELPEAEPDDEAAGEDYLSQE